MKRPSLPFIFTLLSILSVGVILAMCGGCDATKQLTIAEDATAGVAAGVSSGYTDNLITKAQVKSIDPYLDQARDAELKAEDAKAQGLPSIFWPMGAVDAALTDLEAHEVAKITHAATTQQVKP